MRPPPPFRTDQGIKSRERPVRTVGPSANRVIRREAIEYQPSSGCTSRHRLREPAPRCLHLRIGLRER